MIEPPLPMRAKNDPITEARIDDAADRQRIEPELAHREARDRDEHHRDRGHRVGLEEVGRHAGAVADVVADVVRDHGGVARIVLGDSRLDLPDEVGADVSRLRVDPAAKPGEDRDQRAAERKPDEVVDRRHRRVAEPVGEDPVVTGDAEQAEADDEHPGDRPGPKCDVEGRLDAVFRRLGGAHVRADGDVHADEPGGGREHRADEEPDCGPPAELVVEPDQEERGDRDDRNRPVLALEVRRRALLDGAARSRASARCRPAGSAASR